MKKVLKNKPIYILFACFLVLTACRQAKTSDDMTYTCPMHPDVIKNEPSTCPICGMDLVPVHNNADMAVDKDVEALTKPVNEVILSDVKTIYPETLSLTDTILLNGNITYNNNNRKAISSYISGRIEKLYIRYNYQQVRKGQKIMDIYSPDLASVQQEILYLKNNGDELLLQKAINKLRLLGATEQQINQLLNSRKVNYRFGIYSNANGYIVEGNKDNAANIAKNSTSSVTSMNDGMSTSTNSAPQPTESEPLLLREGMYINAGESVFKVYDDSSLWAEFYVPAAKSAFIQKGNTITIDSKNYNIQKLQPYFKDGQNFSIVRVTLSDKNYKIGQLINGHIVSAPVKGLWIPVSAVYHTGNKNIVFTLSNGKLTPKTIITGVIVKDKVLVKEGLTDNQKIAENAALLVDSEGFLLTDKGNQHE